MVLIRRLRRFAFDRPHVFLLQAANGTAARLAVEAWARTHGWPITVTPLDADVVVVCGTSSPPLAALVARVIAGVPAPRAVVTVTGDGRHDELESLLVAARETLWEWPPQRETTLAAPPDDADEQHTEDQDADDEHAGMDHAEDGGTDHGTDQMDHAAMGHGDMDMAMEAAGLPLAERAPDRDGLTLDVLHAPLGPLLAAWPAGLQLTLTLQGDVAQSAEVDVSLFRGAVASGSYWERPWRRALDGVAVTVAEAERRRAAAHLGSLARLLVVAGHDGAARAAARLRDAGLAETDLTVALHDVRALRRRLERSRLLHRATEGLGALTAAAAQAAGVTGPALRASGVAEDARAGSPAYPGFQPAAVDGAGDVRARWRQWLAETEAAIALAASGDARRPLVPVDGVLEGTRGCIRTDGPAPSHALVDVLPELVTGQEIAVVRLIVASLDPDGDDLASPARTAPGEHVHA